MKILLIIQQRIIRAKSQYFLLTPSLLQATEARVGDVGQDPPHHFMPHTSNIEANSLVHFLSLQDEVRLRTGVLFIRRPAVKII